MKQMKHAKYAHIYDDFHSNCSKINQSINKYKHSSFRGILSSKLWWGTFMESYRWSVIQTEQCWMFINVYKK